MDEVIEVKSAEDVKVDVEPIKEEIALSTEGEDVAMKGFFKKLYNMFVETKEVKPEEPVVAPVIEDVKSEEPVVNLVDELTKKDLINQKLIEEYNTKIKELTDKISSYEQIESKKKNSRIINTGAIENTESIEDIDKWNEVQGDVKKLENFMKNEPDRYNKIRQDFLTNPNKYIKKKK